MFVLEDTGPVGEVAERLSALVADLDLGRLLPASLADLVVLGERIERVGHGLKAQAAARVADTTVWRTGGHRSPAEWLASETGTSKTEAGRLVDTGRQLERLPATRAAMCRGDLSPRQVEAVAGAAAADPGAERRLLERAKDRSLRELQEECRRTRVNADPDPEATARRVHARRGCRTWTEDDGATGHLHLTGPIASIARMDNAIRHRADQLFRVARADGRREPSEAYAYDATQDLLMRTGDGTPAPVGADAKIIVRIDHSALVRGRAASGETCEIVGVGPVPVATVREWMDDAFVAAVLTKGEEVQKVVHLGRRFKARQRTALQWQDPLCARMGCSNRLGLEYDHFEDWAATHTTRVEAAKRFCAACHRLKSTGWRVSEPDADGQCAFTPPELTAGADAAAEAVAARRSRRRPRAAQRPLPDTG